jgi:hypothetical protein
MNRPLGAVAILVLLLGGCGQEPSAENASEARNDSVAMTTIRQLPAADQLSRAFDAAFGTSTILSVDGERLSFEPSRLLWIGDRAVLLSSGTNAEDCHACTGALAIHYLRASGSDFEVTGAWPAAVRGWSWGAPPRDWSINSQLADYPVVVAEGGYTGQGITCSSATLTELRPEGPVTSDHIPTGYSNEGAVNEDTGRTFGGEPRRDVEGRIGNIRRSRGFDVAFTGTERFTESYDYRDGRFAPRLAESRGGCG